MDAAVTLDKAYRGDLPPDLLVPAVFRGSVHHTDICASEPWLRGADAYMFMEIFQASMQPCKIRNEHN